MKQKSEAERLSRAQKLHSTSSGKKDGVAPLGIGTRPKPKASNDSSGKRKINRISKKRSSSRSGRPSKKINLGIGSGGASGIPIAITVSKTINSEKVATPETVKNIEGAAQTATTSRKISAGAPAKALNRVDAATACHGSTKQYGDELIERLHQKVIDLDLSHRKKSAKESRMKEDEISSLKVKVKALESKYTTLKEDHQSLKQSLNEELEDLNWEHNMLLEEKESLKTRISYLKQDLEAAEVTHLRIMEEKESMKRCYSELNATLERKCVALTEKIQRITKYYGNLEQQLMEENTKLTDKQNQEELSLSKFLDCSSEFVDCSSNFLEPMCVNLFKEDKTAAKRNVEELEQLRGQNLSLMTEIDSLKTTNSALMRDLESAKKKLQIIGSEKKAAEEHHSIVNEALQNKCQILSKDNNHIAKENERLAIENTALCLQKERIIEQNKMLLKEREKMLKDKDEILLEKDVAEAKVAELDETNKILSDELNEVKASLLYRFFGGFGKKFK